MRLLAQAHALPLFLGTLGYCIEATLPKVGGAENLLPGDVIFSTYAYDSGSHPQDAVVILPVFYDDLLAGFAAIKAHHMDIAAKQPYCTDTTDNFQEGVIFPGVKLYRAGVLQEDLYRTLIANSRLPEALVGDLNAQVGAATQGVTAMQRLIDRHGIGVFEQATETMFDQGEAAVRSFLRDIPNGRYEARGFMDNDGVSDEPVPLHVIVEIDEDNIIVDLRDAAAERSGPINVPLASVISGVRIAVMSFAGSASSANEGHFRPMTVLTKPGTMFDPSPPSPVFMYGWPMQHVIDLTHRALAAATPTAVPAGSGGDVCAVVWWGRNPDGSLWADGGDHFVGQGAVHNRDSNCPLMHVSCSGIRSMPIEVWEARRPSIVEKFEFARDSGGAGRHRGGCGVDIFYRVERDSHVTLPWDRTTMPPWGLDGGHDARANRISVRHCDGTRVDYQKVTDLLLCSGEVLELRTGGGGGYGACRERDPAAVQEDVADGVVSLEAAMSFYPHAFPDGERPDGSRHADSDT